MQVKMIRHPVEIKKAIALPLVFRKYINCQFGVNPVELGCTDGLIFDHTINKCVNPEEGPSDW